MVIDKAHSVAQDDHHFCPKFLSAMKTLKKLHNNQQTPCNCIAMSATFQKAHHVITNFLERPPDRVIWLELPFQGVRLDITVSRCLTLSITQIVTQDYKYPTNMKTIVYTNSKSSDLEPIDSNEKCPWNKQKQKWWVSCPWKQPLWIWRIRTKNMVS